MAPESVHFLPYGRLKNYLRRHHEAGSSEQVPTCALSQIDYGHTMDTFEIAKRFACARELRKGPLGKFE